LVHAGSGFSSVLMLFELGEKLVDFVTVAVTFFPDRKRFKLLQ
jgi:hypothetical protein